MRSFSWLITGILILLCFTAAAGGEAATPGDLEDIQTENMAFSQCASLLLRIEEDAWTVTGAADEDAVSLIIPAEWEGVAVTAIDDYAFAGMKQLKQVTVSDGVRRVSRGAFADCPALTTVSLPASVTVIDDSAFAGSPEVRIYAPADSAAARYAALHSFSAEPGDMADDAGEATPTDLKRTAAAARTATLTDLNSGETKKVWSITYELGGGTNAPENPGSYTEGDSLPLSDPVREGYTFGGWFADRKYKKAVTGITASTAENITLYAKWTANRYTVVFEGNGASNVPAYSKEMTWGTKARLPAGRFRLGGYTFSGWNTQPDGSGTAYADQARVSSLTSVPGAQVVLYAQWKPVLYSITYVLAGGRNDPDNPSGYTAEDAVTFAAPVRDGYTFEGWYSDPRFQKPVAGITAGTTGKMKLYARWSADSFTIRYHSGGADAAKDFLQTCVCGIKNKLAGRVFEREGYSFEGWSTAPDGRGTCYAGGSFLPKSTCARGETLDLYAQWKTVSYTIRYKLSGGTNSAANLSAYTVEDTVLLAEPVRKGYRFDGWYSDAHYRTKITEIPAGSTGNRTLYARWEVYSFTVVFHGNGADNEESYTQSVPCGASVYLKSNQFERQTYTFTGWNTQPDGTGVSYANRQKMTDGPRQDGAVVNLYAQWRPNLKTVTFRGVEFETVAGGADVVRFAGMTDGKICQQVGDQFYKGACLSVAEYYAGAIMTNQTELNLKDALNYKTFRCGFTTEQFKTERAMLRRLYTLLNTGKPQVLMVDTARGYRHFVTVVGYKSSVVSGDTMRAADLLVIDSYDGKLESMDPAIYPEGNRKPFQQDGKYRIEAAQ